MSKKYFVKEGRSVLTSIGVKGPGEVVTAEMITGGEKSLDLLLKSSKNPLSELKPKNVENTKSPETSKDKNDKNDKDGGASKK